MITNNTIFWGFVENALEQIQEKEKDFTLGTENNPIKIGNVEFWIDNNNKDWCYSLPVSKWDCKLIGEELQSYL